MADFLGEYGVFLLLALVIAWFVWLRWLAPAWAGVKTLDIGTYRRTWAKQPHLLLDVRTDIEFARGHSPSAQHMPADAIAKSSAEQLQQLAKGRPVVCICATGNRSAMAAAALAKAGVKPAFNLKGGMLAWRAAGLPVKQGKAEAGE